MSKYKQINLYCHRTGYFQGKAS